ncbi:hypothetical protein ABW19_dt0207182 [Dactylella cylindrospora]|nr:hypothetical protein ABW19_dt0207182 [Dactylella cylindrospora]
MSYGTAAIRYANGTIIDVVKINGTEEYISALRLMADDVKIPREESSFEWLPGVEDFLYHQEEESCRGGLGFWRRTNLIYRYITSGFQEQIGVQRVPRAATLPGPSLLPAKHVPWMDAVTSMISDLKAATEDIQPMNNPTVVISLPDFIQPRWDPYVGYFTLASLRAGVHLRVSISWWAALVSARIPGFCLGDFWVSPCRGQGDSNREVLVVDYSGRNLGLTVASKGWDDTHWPRSVVVRRDLGAGQLIGKGQIEQEVYWSQVKNLFQSTVGPDLVPKIGHVFFTGDAAAITPELYDVVREVFKDNPFINDQWFNRSPQDCVFGASRLNAKIGRRRMRHGSGECIYRWNPICPRGEPDVDEFGGERTGPKSTVKGEL